MDANELQLDYAGEEVRLSPEDQLTFGRGAELDIDDNPLLHRRFGLLFYQDGTWWVRNDGSRLSLSVHDLTSTSFFTLAPGREAAITFEASAIRFVAGPSKYEILVDLPAKTPVFEPSLISDVSQDVAEATVDQSRLPVLGGQRLLLVALAESSLKNPNGITKVPTNKSIARRFGWSTTTFNRRLDRLCAKFAASGVVGVVGGPSDLARDRRQRLVTHAIAVGIVTTADLALLTDHPV